MSDEEDIVFPKISNNMINSDSMSALNENASTYMGVKTIPEGTIPDKNEDYKNKKNKKNKKSKEKNKKNKKKNKNKKNKNKKIENSFSSYISSSSYTYSYSSSSSSSSSYSSSSSDSEIVIEKKRNTHLNKKKKKILNEKDKKNEKINIKEKNNKIKKVKKEEKSKRKEENIEETTKNEKKFENKTNEIETKFEWDEGGNNVYLTGSFCDWKEFYLMKKNGDGKFSFSLPLPRGFHQYKFKIDDIWTYSRKQPKYEDNGNINNFIDTTDYENLNEEKKEEEKLNESINNEEEISQKEKLKEKTIEKKKEKSKNKEKEKEKSKDKKTKNKSNIKEKTKINNNNNNKATKKKRNSSNHNIHFLNDQKNYSIYYPLRAEFSKKPLALPGLYKTYYILIEKKNKKIKERQFSQIEYVDSANNSIYGDETGNKSKNQSLNNSLYFTNDINPYVKFQNLYHIHSNHLHSKEAININTNVTSIISRYRFKFSTFIYYKEKQPINALDKKKHSKTVRIKRRKNSKISKGPE